MQPPAAPPALEMLRVQHNVYAIFGAGGNVTVQIGDEGVLMVDSGLAASAPRAARAKSASCRRGRFASSSTRTCIRITWAATSRSRRAGDRGPISSRGEAAAADPLQPLNIIAHENVLRRMTAALPPVAARQTGGAERLRGMPIDEYFTPTKDMHFNGEAVVLYHEPNAHTDGDSVVLFRGSDVVSAGDIFTPGGYPFIDSRTAAASRARSPRSITCCSSPCPDTRRKAARTSFPATAASATKPTSSNSATWSSSSAIACRT